MSTVVLWQFSSQFSNFSIRFEIFRYFQSFLKKLLKLIVGGFFVFFLCLKINFGKKNFGVFEQALAWVVFSPMIDGSVVAFFIYFSQISMFLNGVGVGCFVTKD